MTSVKKAAKKVQDLELRLKKWKGNMLLLLDLFCPYLLPKKTIHNEGHDAVYDCTMSM